jgi:hypothetical protein
MLYTEDRSTGVPEPPVSGGFTNRLPPVGCAATPADVPVMVAPAGLPAPVRGAVLLAVNVAVLVVALVEVNEAVTPVGKPDGAVRLTEPVKLLKGDAGNC